MLMGHDACGVGFIADTRPAATADMLIGDLRLVASEPHRVGPAKAGPHAESPAKARRHVPMEREASAERPIANTDRAFGVVYVWDPQRMPNVSGGLAVDVPTASDLSVRRALVAAHASTTGSPLARAILRRDRHLSGVHRVAPRPVADAAFTEAVRAVNE